MKIVTMGLAAALLFTSGSCFNYGNRIADFPPANGPQGAQVSMRVSGEIKDRVGELYAIDSTGVIIRSDGLTRIHWRRLVAFDTDKMGRNYSMRGAEFDDATRRAAIASVSRFPQGLTSTQLAYILEQMPAANRTLEEIQ